MKNLKRIVLAEDDRDSARLLQAFFSQVGGYEVAVTHRADEVLPLMESNGAGWLILDLQLEDGPAVALVPKLRQRYRDEIFLLVLTGLWNIYTEQMLFTEKVDDVLRKPHRPQDIYARMQRLVEREEGRAAHSERIGRLLVGESELDLARGVLTAPKGLELLSEAKVRLLRMLAQRDRYGWRFVQQADLLVALWGKRFYEDPQAYSERLRALNYRLHRQLGVKIIYTQRGNNNTSLYRLSASVQAGAESAGAS